jgi:Tetratricopeptide repeat
MRHQCSSCFSEFFDDAQSSKPTERVFCVFCGAPLPATSRSAGSNALPFSGDHPREEPVALGVIGGGSSSFPDTLRQFRASGAPSGTDSLMPTHTEREQVSDEPGPAPWRLGRFWTSLAVGFGVGACAAVLFAGRAPSPPPRAVASNLRAPPPAAPAVVLSSCATPSVTPPAAPAESQVPVTPQLEKRFWLDRARNAQRQYRLAEAERLYRRALFHAPRDSEALAGLGELELLRGERAAADARFREALEANSDYVPARVALADLHWQSGRAEEARREYRDIAEHYSADLFPPYVTQRLGGDVCAPQCPEVAPGTESPALRDAPQ